MQVRAIIQARMLSQRFRGKSMIAINQIPLLHRVINTIKGFEFVDSITVATTTSEADDPISLAANALEVNSYRGSALNVLERFIAASSDMNEEDCIIRITADNPFYHDEISTKAFQSHIESKGDYTYIDGLSHLVPEFIKVGALREAFRSTKSAFDTEHVTPYLRKHDDLFQLNQLPGDFCHLRADLDPFFAVDTREDLDRVEEMLLELGEQFSLEQAYGWLDKKYKPEMLQKERPLTVDICGHQLGYRLPTFIVAEIGQNHNGDMSIAKELIDMAARCGADAVKFQKRDIPSELTLEAYSRPYDNKNSFGKTYGEHREFLELSEEQHKELKEYAQSKDLIYFCTPCDITSVEVMERVGSPFYKVASRDLTNLPLMKKLHSTGKVVIISTGMADLEDIDDAFKELGANPEKIIIMQCTSQYPAAIENVNLRAMDTIKERFNCLVGLSDHTPGIITSVAASVLGAVMIEKHITLARAMKGSDHAGSLEEEGLRRLVNYVRTCEKASGDGIKTFNPVANEAKIKLARSLTSKVKIEKGAELNEEMLTLKSPGDGLQWKKKDLILGKKAKRPIDADVTLRIEDFE